jgi:hypothetical protein
LGGGFSFFEDNPMKRYGSTFLLLIAQWGIPQIATAQPSTADRERTAKPDDFFAAINNRARAASRKQVIFADLPDAAAAVEIVQRSRACALAVGGKYADYLVSRFENTRYWEYWIVTTRQYPDGRIQALIGWSFPEANDVVVTQSYWQPTAAWVEVMPDGTVERINLLPHMETSLGFKHDSLTKRIFRVLHLLHEHGHMNFAIPRDDVSLRQSMLNTRKIAEACYPEIVEPFPKNPVTKSNQVK